MGQVTNEELKTHFLTFSPNAISKSEQGKINAWLVALAKKNNSSHVFEKKSFNALLLSRWFITCIRSKSYLQLLQIKLPWYNLSVLFQSLRLMMTK
jgi:hypothetical protein